MAYNKRQKLVDNTEAIRVALQLRNENRQATDEEKDVLRKYSGFGGLKFILNDVDIEGTDVKVVESWNRSDRTYYQKTRELYAVIRDGAKDEKEFKQLVQSMKNSVLTSFYTPNEVINGISAALKDSGIKVRKMLDPSAGLGRFGEAFARDNEGMEAVSFEKDLLTGMILKGLHPEMDVTIDGFETIKNDRKDTFDLVTSNIPFGDIKVFDPDYSNSNNPVRRSASGTIHNYFFLKAIDMAREGGLVAFITSRGVADSPSNEAVRREMLSRANLVTAVRLPDGMFRDEAGTDVGSDLIILQKDSMKSGLTAFEDDFVTSVVTSDGITHNGYIDLKRDENILMTDCQVGTDPYGKRSYVYRYDGDMEVLGRQLAKMVAAGIREANADLNYSSHAPQEQVQAVVPQPKTSRQSQPKQQESGPVQLDLFAMWDNQEEERQSMLPRPFSGDILSHYRDGVIVVDDGQVGTLTNVGRGTQFQALELNQGQIDRLKQYILIRDTYENLYKTEAELRSAQDDLRQQLNYHYDRFVMMFGAMGQRVNARVILLDVLGRDTMTIENGRDGQFEKADIFDRPVSFNANEVTHVDNAQDALNASLNRYGKVNMDYMSELTDFSPLELREQLRGMIYLNPAEGYAWETASRFLSGNVVRKLEDIQKMYDYDQVIYEEHREDIEEAVEALKGVIPTPIKFEELDFNFGERWMPTGYFSDFASEFFGTNISVDYTPMLDEFIVEQTGSYSEKIRSEFVVTPESGKELDGLDLLRHALYNTVPVIKRVGGYRPSGDAIMVPDHEKIQLAASKIDQIRDGFQEWIMKHDGEWKDSLAEMYNKKYNCFVRAKFDGSHQTFPGLDLKALASSKYKIQDIYKSQKDAVWMIIQNGGGICDHEVGTGKTLIMCIAAHEMRRLGLVHKPIIIGMKANISAIAETYQTAFPDDRILYASKKDFSDRKNFLNRMKNNDYDCIIMSHDQFKLIPQSARVQVEVMQEEIDALDEALDVYERMGNRVSGKMKQGLETRKNNLKAALLSLNHTLASRADDIVDFETMGIDHVFVDESQVFKNLAFTTRDSRVAGLGDPKGSQIARQLQYAIRTIQDRNGRDLGATFFSGTTISNSLVELYLLFKYLRPEAMADQNIHSFDAWAAVFARKSRDYEINVAGQIVMKERFRNFIKVPELGSFYNEVTDYKTAADVGLDRPKMDVELVNIPPTPDHEDFFKRLVRFAQNGDGEEVFRDDLDDNDKQAKMLLVTNMGKKASLSPVLVNPNGYSEGDNTKIGFAAKNISEYYYKYNEFKGTQFVFCDLSTAKKGEWSVYQELKDRLVEKYGIPADEIAFIQDATTEAKKNDYIKKMNDGVIRVMIGSTTTLGTGVNAQERAVAVHHLDLPWRPSDLEQRNGRAVRKGNEVARDHANNTVKVFVYAVERSLDSYNFYLLQAKSEFIRQMKTGSLGKRSFDQGGMDEENGMPFAEYVAITSGNNDLLERAKLEQRVLGLESERKAFYNEQRLVQNRLERAKHDLEYDKGVLNSLMEDRAALEKVAQFNENGTYVNAFVPENGATDIREIGRFMQDQARRMITDEVQVGTIYGLPVMMRPQTEDERPAKDKKNAYRANMFFVRGHISYTTNFGQMSFGPLEMSASYAVYAINTIPALIESYQERVDTLEKRIPELEVISTKSWDKGDQLQEMKKQLSELDRKIQNDMDIKTLQESVGLEKPEKLPCKIEHRGYGSHKWELKYKFSDYPFVNGEDRKQIRNLFQGESWGGGVSGDEVTMNFKHQYGAEEAFKEVSRLNALHMKDREWLLKAVRDIHDESALPAYTRLREMGYDRFGKEITDEPDNRHLQVIALTDYASVRDLAHGVKENVGVAIDITAEAMAKLIGDLPHAKDCVLVPMPCSGRDYTDDICEKISELTGIPYKQSLDSARFSSLYDWKKQHPGKPMPDLFFVEDVNRPLPEGKVPIIIDNVLDTGHTAWAALEALQVQPIVLVLSATGRENTEGHDIKVSYAENGLKYIREATPVGVGYTGKSQSEINRLIREAWSFDHEFRYYWGARDALHNVGLDEHSGYPSYLVEDIVKKVEKETSAKKAAVAKELLGHHSIEESFTKEQLFKLSVDDIENFNSIYNEVLLRQGAEYKYRIDDYNETFVILYRILQAKADGKLGISQIQQPENPEAAIGQMRQEFRMMSVDGLMTLANSLDVDPDDKEWQEKQVAIEELNARGIDRHTGAEYTPVLSDIVMKYKEMPEKSLSLYVDSVITRGMVFNPKDMEVLTDKEKALLDEVLDDARETIEDDVDYRYVRERLMIVVDYLGDLMITRETKPLEQSGQTEETVERYEVLEENLDTLEEIRSVIKEDPSIIAVIRNAEGLSDEEVSDKVDEYLNHNFAIDGYAPDSGWYKVANEVISSFKAFVLQDEELQQLDAQQPEDAVEKQYLDALESYDQAFVRENPEKSRDIAKAIAMSFENYSKFTDWFKQESVLAKMRVQIKRVLKAGGYEGALIPSVAEAIVKKASEYEKKEGVTVYAVDNYDHDNYGGDLKHFTNGIYSGYDHHIDQAVSKMGLIFDNLDHVERQRLRIVPAVYDDQEKTEHVREFARRVCERYHLTYEEAVGYSENTDYFFKNVYSDRKYLVLDAKYDVDTAIPHIIDRLPENGLDFSFAALTYTDDVLQQMDGKADLVKASVLQQESDRRYEEDQKRKEEGLAVATLAVDRSDLSDETKEAVKKLLMTCWKSPFGADKAQDRLMSEYGVDWQTGMKIGEPEVKMHKKIQPYQIVPEEGFFYVDYPHGTGISEAFSNQIVATNKGEVVERDGRIQFRFYEARDAYEFTQEIGLLNNLYTTPVRDKLIDIMRGAGIKVNTDVEEGERILNQANENIREQAQKSGIYSEAFKEWFGDWEKVYRLLKLKTSVDASIVGNEIEITDDYKQNRKNALNYGKTLRDVYVNKDTGERILLSAGNRRGGLREILQHDFLDIEHIQSIAAIPQIIENAIFITTEDNKDKNNYPNVVNFQHYLCGLKIGNVDYTVRAVIALHSNGERYYDHKLTSIEKGKLVELALNGLASPELSSLEEREDSELLQPTNENRETIESSVSGYKDKHLFSILQTNSSKILKNGVPMVFYHGTNVEFDEFDISKSAGMAMFTSSEEIARKFAGRWPMYDKEGNLVTDENGNYKTDGYVMPVYLNVRNPKIIDMDGYDWFGNGVGENAGKSINKGRKTNFSYLEAKKAKREGYDGLILKNVTDGGGKSDHVIVFNANQIKSVYNIGTYRKDSNNIYEHRVVSDPVINGVIANFAKKYHLPIDAVRDYYEGMGREDLRQAQQAYYAIYRAYKENVKAQLGEDYKLSTFSHIFAEVKEEIYNIFGSVDALRDKEVQQALSSRDMLEAAKQSAQAKVQAEHERLNSLREMSDEELDAAYFKTLDFLYPKKEKEQRQRDILNVMAERRGYIDTASEYQGSLAFNGAAPSDGGWYDTKDERVQAFKATRPLVISLPMR